MNRSIAVLCLLGIISACAAPSPTRSSSSVDAIASAAAAAPGGQASPRLAVVIVVDQMRADYLSHYNTYFTGGFARMIGEGTWFRSGWVDHAYTNSLPGHTSIVTGAYPRRHGVTDNVWHERGPDGEPVVKSGFTLVDRRNDHPYALDVPTINEWFQGSHADAKFVALGSNNAPRLYAGQLRGPVFWFDGQDGGYVTNTNYADDTPAWLTRFNKERLPAIATQPWVNTIPTELQTRLRPDASPFENRGDNYTFPYGPPMDAENALDWISMSPFADAATLELAAISIDELQLGKDAVPDILNISLNSLDDIGHAYGPFSHEQTDALLQLDRNLGEFMQALDELVGENNWVLALTADHGVATTPEQQRLWGSVEGRRVSRDVAQKVVDAANAAAESAVKPADIAALAARAVEQFDFVETVYTEAEVATFSAGVDSIEGLLALSYRPGRVPAHPFYIREKALPDLGIFIVLKPGIMMDWGTAIHGSQYDYDRRVPLLFYGAGVAACQRFDRAATIDVAPTVAALAAIPIPATADGVAHELGQRGCRATR